MTDYAVGDIHGCLPALERMLDRVGFSPSRDCLWSVGDLINRGPDSLGTLRYFERLGNATKVVLGNHDLHLLAAVFGGHGVRSKDTIGPILEAEDADRLVGWLRHQRVMEYDANRDLAMVHAGLPHVWSVDAAQRYARELEAVIQGPEAEAFFREMYGNEPGRWDDGLAGVARWRLITNYFTRMRFIAADGTLDLATKETGTDGPAGYAPWFQYERPDQTRVVFGHWAALNGATNSDRYIGLDTGCVWGGRLSLMNLDTGERLYEPGR
ncbi:bis(5'nucleosyl)-tetraphosphatase ApaH [Tamilnaduibacter salinus]|uniref:bis(5'-nucleosyl)-tetraphosphatase (symmetrical) n=1 Tax=Tamilnaduibacter salinus TaxID=1484056 RepID=A0A2U1CWX4_9GAMM|nr:symmetrical bis(5'-nucleosyl)-tetraphosphatase [Tamilnaduibacter salinus]PVY76456.1 bis(5'nucleosyl)-tetraphosphatase ApaH [Tamilnaduibacter salinus]